MSFKYTSLKLSLLWPKMCYGRCCQGDIKCQLTSVIEESSKFQQVKLIANTLLTSSFEKRLESTILYGCNYAKTLKNYVGYVIKSYQSLLFYIQFTLNSY